MAKGKIGLNALADRVETLQDAGATDEEIAAEIQRLGWSPDAYAAGINAMNAGEQPPEMPNDALGVLSNISNGAALGFGDEIGAAGQTLVDKIRGSDESWGDRYRANQQSLQTAREGWNAENPWKAGAANAVGATVTGLGTAGSGPVAQSLQGANRLERILAGTKLGGIFGATQGVGDADPGLANAATGAAEGAVGGAAVGAGIGAAGEALPPLWAGAKGLASYVRNIVGDSPVAALLGGGEAAGAASAPGAATGVQGMSRPGADAVLRAIQADNMTPAGLQAGLQASREAGVPANMVEVGGPNVRGLGRATVTLPGPARAIAEAGTFPRAAPSAQRARLEPQLEQLAGREIPTPEALANEAAIAKGRRGEDYRQAYSLGAIDEPKAYDARVVEKLESRPIYAEAHNAEVEARARTQGKESPITPLFNAEGRVTRPPTVEDIDVIKKRLDTEVYGAQGLLTPDSAPAKANVAHVEGARQSLLEPVDQRAPGYKATRERAGTDFEVQRAAEMAQDITRLSPQEVRAFMLESSQAAKDAFRANALLAYRNQLLKASDRSANPALVRELYGSGDGAKREVLRILFNGDKQALANFEQSMQRELEAVSARNFVFGGSNTANKLAEVSDLQGGGAGEAVLDTAHAVMHPTTGLPNVAAKGVSRWANRRQSAMTAGRRGEIAEQLFTDNAGKADAFLRDLETLRLMREESMRNAPTAAGVAGSGASAARENQDWSW